MEMETKFVIVCNTSKKIIIFEQNEQTPWGAHKKMKKCQIRNQCLRKFQNYVYTKFFAYNRSSFRQYRKNFCFV